MPSQHHILNLILHLFYSETAHLPSEGACLSSEATHLPNEVTYLYSEAVHLSIEEIFSHIEAVHLTSEVACLPIEATHLSIEAIYSSFDPLVASKPHSKIANLPSPQVCA